MTSPVVRPFESFQVGEKILFESIFQAESNLLCAHRNRNHHFQEERFFGWNDEGEE
jgi:hypothetical protein